MPIKTFKGMIPVGEQIKINLSTNDGLTGYKIKEFKILSKTPGVGQHELVGKIRLTSDSNIGPTVDLNDTDILAVVYHIDLGNANVAASDSIILDKETFNQDIYVNITDATGATDPANFYIELEQFNIDLNTSTYHTLKNIRSITGPGFEFL